MFEQSMGPIPQSVKQRLGRGPRPPGAGVRPARVASAARAPAGAALGAAPRLAKPSAGNTLRRIPQPPTFRRVTAIRSVSIPLACLLVSLGSRGVAAQGACSPPDPKLPGPSRDLYCIELFPTPQAPEAAGTVQLDWVPGPYTVSVTRDGTQQFNLRISLRGLPGLPPGPRAGYVAWAAPPTMSRITRLGPVRGGESTLGPVTMDRFVVLISAEPDTSAVERRGPLLLRGESAGNRLRPPDLFQFALGSVGLPDGGSDHQHHAAGDSLGWTGVPMPPGLAMLPSEMALRPPVAAWLPAPVHGTPTARPTEVISLADGDTLRLEAGLVLRTIGGRSHTMFGFNGQQPGPLLSVRQGTEVVVEFTNRLPLPSTVHWHGLRLDYRFDGTPDLSQAPVPPGGHFTYRLRFPDGGLFWYHPHVRDDIQQDLGLAGNILVRAPEPGWLPADREAVLLLDDLLVNDDGLVPYGRDTPTHAAMGRIGNLLLVNGEPSWTLRARPGERLRLFLTNAASARTFNLSVGDGHPLELVGADIGPLEQPVPIDHVVLAPAERHVVDVRFAHPGRYPLLNRVRALDHLHGRFFGMVDTLGFIEVDGEALRAPPPRAAPPPAGRSDIAAITARLSEATPTRVLELGVTFEGLPFVSERLMRLDSIYFQPVEWAGTMPGMNWATLATQAPWRIRDLATGRDNHEIGWRFRRGDLLRLRLVGARDVLHAMQHPIHLHGQRFLVLAVGGVPNPHLAWKDTVLVPAGGTVDLLVDLSNPGPWMLHCHIAEHLGAGMMTTITVEEE